jgi:hypothetical protein
LLSAREKGYSVEDVTEGVEATSDVVTSRLQKPLGQTMGVPVYGG